MTCVELMRVVTSEERDGTGNAKDFRENPNYN